VFGEIEDPRSSPAKKHNFRNLLGKFLDENRRIIFTT